VQPNIQAQVVCPQMKGNQSSLLVYYLAINFSLTIRPHKNKKIGDRPFLEEEVLGILKK